MSIEVKFYKCLVEPSRIAGVSSMEHKMKLLLFLSVFLTCAFASGTTPAILFRRQSSQCYTGYTNCGRYCIPPHYICCPDGSGGCDPNIAQCWLGNEGGYFCCSNGKVCDGPGGAVTDSTYVTSFYTTTTRTTSSLGPTPTPIVVGGSLTCETGWQLCGDDCIPAAWQCCPDLSGGCDPDVSRCWLGSNGLWGCCEHLFPSCAGGPGLTTTLSSTYSAVVGSPTSTMSQTSSQAINTPTPASISATTRTASSSAAGRPISASISSTSPAQLLNGGQHNDGLLASLVSLVIAVFALVI